MKGPLTDAERQERWDQIAEAQAINEDIDEQVRALESQRASTLDASRLRHEILHAELLDDPLICDPHGIESTVEGPGAMSAGGLIHLNSDGSLGDGCYARSIGRRSEFTPEFLEQYRQTRKRRG